MGKFAESSSKPEFSAFFSADIFQRVLAKNDTGADMSLNERLEKEYVEAYKSKAAEKLAVLRLLKTAIKNRLVAESRPRDTLSDDEIMDVIIKQAKQRQDSIEQYNAANRKDLAEKEERELAILREYLPKKLSAEELAEAIEKAVAETGASGAKDMGKVMSAIMAAHKGQVDGKEVSAAVKARLA